jgi:O-antigen/teichoic acid export membrane protein
LRLKTFGELLTRRMKRLTVNTVVYGVANSLAAGAPLLLLPLFTKYLSPSEYGEVALYSTVVVLLSSLISFGSYAAIQRKFYDLSSEHFQKYVASALQGILLMGGCCSTLILLLWVCSAQQFGIEVKWFFLGSLSATSLALQQLLQALWQVEEKAFQFLGFQIANSIFLVGLPILSVGVLKFGVSGAIYANAMALCLFGLLTLLLLDRKGHVRHRLSKTHISHIVKFGYPLFPQLAAGWAIAMFDRFLIQKHWGLAAVGTYALAFQVSQPLSVLSTALTQAITPTIYNALKSGHSERRRTIRHLHTLAMLAITSVALVIGILSIWIIKEYVPNYEASIPLIPLFVLGLTLNGFYRILTIEMMYYEKTKEIAIIVLAVAGLSVLSNFYIIPRFGVMGAGVVSCTSFAIILAVSFWVTTQTARKMSSRVLNEF